MHTNDIFELSDDQIDMVSGAAGIGSVSSDAVFGAGVAVGAVAVTLAGTGFGVIVAAPLAVIAGGLIGWGIRK